MDKKAAIRVHKPTHQSKAVKKKSKRTLNFAGPEKFGKPYFDRELFTDLVRKLDEQIEKCTLCFYKNLLAKIKTFVGAERNGDLIPTLFLCGRCVVDWNIFFEQICAKIRDLRIHRIDSDNLAKGFTDLDNEDKSKNLLFLRLSFSNSEDLSHFDRLITQLVDKKNVYLVLHSNANFSASFERISRITFTKLTVSSAFLDSPVDFEQLLFENFIPMGILNSQVSFDGRILTRTHRSFLSENHSVIALKKHLVLALLEYCREKRGKLTTSIFKKVEEKAILYRHILEVFYNFVKSNNISENTLSIFMLSCKIQSDERLFSDIYETQKAGWRLWSKDTWIERLSRISRTICYTDPNQNFPNDSIAKHIETCKELKERIGNSTDENDEPVDLAKDVLQKSIPSPKTPPKCRWQTHDARPIVSRRVNTPKSASFMLDQQKKRSELVKRSTLPEALVVEVISFLDALFLSLLEKFPASFVASVPDDSLLGAALSVEIDAQLHDYQVSNDGRQLDVCFLYQLLIDSSRESCNAQLATIYEAFVSYLQAVGAERALPNRGGRTPNRKDTDNAPSENARFFTALAQLELIGVVRLVSDGVLRLIYLPSSAISV